jgi:membrane complex biogenesis BtpA family protein
MFKEIFGTAKPIIGVIHLLPLPGSARFDNQLETIFLRAEQEAAALASGGAHGIIIENFFDAPFTKGRVDTAAVCALTIAARRVMSVCDLPIGLNVLRNDGLSALAIASTVGAKFVRINVYTGAMLTDQGIIEGQAHELLNYRRELGTDKTVKIFADVLVKHASPLTADVDIEQVAKDTVHRGLADAAIVSGVATGASADIDDLRAVRHALPDTPILVGSGITKENVNGLLAVADGAIVASSLKRQGKLENAIDVERVRSLVSTAKGQFATKA